MKLVVGKGIAAPDRVVGGSVTTRQSSQQVLRRLGSYLLFGGGAVGLIGGGLIGLLAVQGMIAKHVIGDADGDAPDADGLYGEELLGDPLSFVVLGDSAACGYGVEDPAETPGALLASGLAQLADRPVRLTRVAVVGAESKHLENQLPGALRARPDVALIIIGGNDVTHQTPPAQSVRPLVTAIEALSEAGCEVVVGTCPDLGTIRPLAQPLRQLARVWSRRLAEMQDQAASAAGARTVALGSLLGPEFSAAPSELFGPDRFHPSATGYASAAAAVLPQLAAAVHAWPEDESGVPLGDGAILPITFTN